MSNTLSPLRRLDDYRWEVPVDYKPGMRVPGIIYADEALIRDIVRDQSLEQVANTACLPGVVRAALAMPDMHFGYGFPIGGVVATDAEAGVISPGGVGFDINCGVRLITTQLEQDAINETIKPIINALYQHVPTGVGSQGSLRLTPQELRQVVVQGARWAVERGMGTPADLDHMEANGCLAGADPDTVGPKPYERGRRQLGTLGAGNHFAEIQYVETVYDEPGAAAFGLHAGQVTLMIHSGSRGFGHQVCTDYLGVMDRCVKQYGITLPDRQLCCAPITSPEGQDYLAAMRAAANYAWANRQCLMHWALEAIGQALALAPSQLGARLLYDVAHNIVKFEEHRIGGVSRRLAVHRKGATRAFPAGHPEVPAPYRAVGQPVIIPGDMGRCSYVLVGTPQAMAETFGTSCHGAGRRMSRSAALRATKGRSIVAELEAQGVIVRGATNDTIREEFPEAYKDVSQVAEVVHQAGIAKKVVRLKPLGVIKG